MSRYTVRWPLLMFAKPPPLRIACAEGLPHIGTMPSIAIMLGTAISVAILGFNFLGDSLQDILDPRLRT